MRIAALLAVIGLGVTSGALAQEPPPSATEAFIDAAKARCVMDARDASLGEVAELDGMTKADPAVVPLPGPRNAWATPTQAGHVYLSAPAGAGKEQACVVTGYGVDLVEATTALHAWWGPPAKAAEGEDGSRVERTPGPSGGLFILETWPKAGSDRPNAQATYLSAETHPAK